MLFEPPFRDLQLLFIMIIAAREITGSLSGRKIGIALLMQHGIMREVNDDALLIPFRPEGPSIIEIALCRQRRQGNEERKEG